MTKELKHLFFSILVGLTVVALSGWLIAGIQALTLNITVAIAWVAWGAVGYLQHERKNNE